MKQIKLNVILLLLATISFFSFSANDFEQIKPYIGAENNAKLCNSGDYGGSPYYIYNNSPAKFSVTFKTKTVHGGKSSEVSRTVTVNANSKYYLGCTKRYSNSGTDTYSFSVVNSKQI